MGFSEKTQHAIRRSTRLPLEVPVLVTSLDPAQPFSEPCNTTLVNAHGCGLIVPRALAHGMRVRLEIVSTKRHTTARVSEVVPLGGDPETWLIGLELDIPGNFWGIDYAPSDWKVDEQKVDGQKMDEQKIDESKVDEQKIDEQKIDEPKLEAKPLARRRAAAARSRADGGGQAGSFASLAPDRHQRGRLLPRRGCSISRRHSGAAQYSGVGHGVFAGRSGAGVARADGYGSRVHASCKARSPGPGGRTHRPAHGQS